MSQYNDKNPAGPISPAASRQAAIEAAAAIVRKYLEAQPDEPAKIVRLAERAGIAHTTLYRLLAEKGLPDKPTCEAIEVAMELPPGQLLRAAGYAVVLAGNTEKEGDELYQALSDPRIRLYMSQWGEFPEATKQIILQLMQSGYEQARIQPSHRRRAIPKRPSFARPPDPNLQANENNNENE